jgi:hypothetical protein
MAQAFTDSIMKGPDGNKCYFVTAKIGDEDVTVGYTGNGPMSKENAQIISYVPELVAALDLKDADLAAANAAKEEAERQWWEPERRAYQAENMIAEISRELDRLGAPILQPSTFPYSPIGRLRALIASQVGEYYGATMSIAKARAEEAEKKLCTAREALEKCVEALSHALDPSAEILEQDADILLRAKEGATAALSSSSPCRHEARVKELEETSDKCIPSRLALLEKVAEAAREADKSLPPHSLILDAEYYCKAEKLRAAIAKAEWK